MITNDEDCVCGVYFIIGKDGTIDVRTTWSSEDTNSIMMLSRLIVALHSGNLKAIHMHILKESIEHLEDVDTINFLNKIIEIIITDHGEKYHTDPTMKPSQTFNPRRM